MSSYDFMVRSLLSLERVLVSGGQSLSSLPELELKPLSPPARNKNSMISSLTSLKVVDPP